MPDISKDESNKHAQAYRSSIKNMRVTSTFSIPTWLYFVGIAFDQSTETVARWTSIPVVSVGGIRAYLVHKGDGRKHCPDIFHMVCLTQMAGLHKGQYFHCKTEPNLVKSFWRRRRTVPWSNSLCRTKKCAEVNLGVLSANTGFDLYSLATRLPWLNIVGSDS